MIKQMVPIITWLAHYRLSNLRWDIVAGITLAFFVLPESMAYATLAGVPAHAGIYCCIVGGLFFALFTSTKQVVVGPTSAISLMIASTVATVAQGDVQRIAMVAALTALLVCVLCIIAYVLRLSSLVSFISEDVLLGFKAGAALSIISTQLPKFLGAHSSGNHFFARMWNFLQHLPETNLYVLGFGVLIFLLLRIGNHYFKGRPVSLVVVAASVAVFALTDIGQYGFVLAGQIPQGLPAFQLPSIQFADIDGVLALAMGCFFVGYIETVSVARTYAEKYGQPLNSGQELLSLGAANLAAAFAGGYPISGGLSQSMVNDKAGAKTPMALILCTIVLSLILVFFTHLFQYIPEVVLAAVVLDAVLGLIKIKALKKLYNLSRGEFNITLIAIVAVLFFGILKGVLIAAICSIVAVIIRAKSPNVAVLGQIPGTDKFSDIKRNPDNTEIPELKILRIESAILYFNAENVYELMHELMGHHPIKHVIIDLSSSPKIDVAGAKMLCRLSDELKALNRTLKIVGAIGTVRDMLRKLDMEEQIGHISRRDTIQDEVYIYKHS